MRALGAPDFPTLREALRVAIERERAGDPLRPITVLTRDDLSRDETRRILAIRTGGFLGIDLVSFPTWIRRTATPVVTATGGRGLPDPGWERLIARLLAERESRRTKGRSAFLLTASGSAAGLARAVASSLAELRRGGFTSGVLTAGGSPARDPLRRELVELLGLAERELVETNRYDVGREEEAAAEALRSPRARADRGSPLVLFGFHDLTPRQRRVVEAAAIRRPVTLLVPGPGGPGEEASTSLLDWVRDRGGELELRESETRPRVTVSAGLFEEPAIADPGPEALELVTYPGPAAEVRGIARRIAREIAEFDRGLDDFLITVSREGPSPLLFRRVFAKARIPLRDRAGISALRTEGGRRALALARAMAAGPGGRAGEALDFLTSSPSAATGEPEGATSKDHTSALRAARSWSEAAERFREAYTALLGEDGATNGAAGVGLPSEVERALDALESTNGTRPCRAREFASALIASLASVVSRHAVSDGPGSAAVLLVRIDQARGLSRPVVFHTGFVEGAVPGAPREDPLLPDRYREALNTATEHTGHHLPLRWGARSERVLLTRFALEAGEEKTILSWSVRAQAGGARRNPAGLLLDLVSARAGTSLDAEDPRFLEAAPAPVSDEARARPADATDLDLALLSGARAPGQEELAVLLSQPRSRHLVSALRAAEARWSERRLGPWDGVLERETAVRAAWRRVDPGRRAWSPTALEAMANCPFSFLVTRILELSPAVDPEDDFDAAERGRIFHELHERLYRGLLDAERLPLRVESLPDVLRRLDALLAEKEKALAVAPGAARVLRRATLADLRADLAILLARDARRPPEGRAVPRWFELPFGAEGDVAAAPAFDLGDGRRLPLRGRADRVDLRGDGAVDVIDLKTGRPAVRDGEITGSAGGKAVVHLQLPLYLTAVGRALGREPGCARYDHVTAKGGWRSIEFTAEDLESRRPRIEALLRHAVDRCHRGWFPCTPGDRCCHPELAPACGPAVAPRFALKIGDPELDEHLALLRAGDETPAAEERSEEARR